MTATAAVPVLPGRRRHTTVAGVSTARGLREARSRSGLTQDAVARRVGVAKGTYVAWERGRSDITVDVLPRVAAALGCTPADLVTWATS